MTIDPNTIEGVKNLGDAIRAEVGKAITGQTDTVDLLLVALFANGHVLLEGPPGTAKTFLARCFAASLGLDYGRIQFTPDLMPGDIVGANLFNFQTSTFTLTKGPIFCELLLADEINRTPPKTQAALLEAMQERSVTFDGTTHKLSSRFMVVATQNPIEQQGVYPLPEAQLDRFLFKHILSYPSLEDELAIVTKHGSQFGAPRSPNGGLPALLTPKRSKPPSPPSHRSASSMMSSAMSSISCAQRATVASLRAAHPPALRQCSPARRGPTLRSTVAIMSSPTM